MSLEKHLEEIGEKRIQNWKALKPTQRHMALMYFYRLRTDFENIESYIETHEFRKLGVSPDEYPTYFGYMTLPQLWEEAMDAIGNPKKLNVPNGKFFFESSDNRSWAKEFLGTHAKVEASHRQDAEAASGRSSSKGDL